MESAFLSKEEQAPLTACQKCKDRPCIKTGKICDEVEALLPKPQGGISGRKIKFYEPNVLEDIANKQALKLKGLRGRKCPQHEIE